LSVGWGTSQELHLELTLRCNLNCGHCGRVRPGSPGEMSRERAIEVVGELRALGVSGSHSRW